MEDVIYNISFLQSQEWGNLQKELGKRVLWITNDDARAVVLEQRLPLNKKYLYAPRGPIFSGSFSARSLEKFVEEIKNTPESCESIFLRIEPPLEYLKEAEDILLSAGFINTAQTQPRETCILSLSKSESELKKEMEHDTRYAIRVSERRGVKISVFESIEGKKKSFDDFWKIFSETNKRHGLSIYAHKYYEAVARLSGRCKSKIFLACLDDKIIAGAIIIFFNDTATYLYAASLAGYGKFNAPSLILWYAILDAKKDGCLKFDMWGISSEKKEWASVTAFKKSFGGSAVVYIGTWDFVFKPAWYKLYKIAKKVIL